MVNEISTRSDGRVVPLNGRAASPTGHGGGAWLADAFLHAPVAMAVWDSNRRLAQCNTAYRTLHADIADLLIPGTALATIAGIAAGRGLLPDGADPAAWARDRLTPDLPPAEEPTRQGRWIRRAVATTPTGTLIESCTDITDQRQREQGLRMGHARLDAIMAALPDLLVQIDAAGRYRAVWNPGAAPTSADTAGLAGRRIEEVHPVPLAARLASHLDSARTTGRLQVLEYEGAEEPPGGPRRFEVRTVPMSGGDTLSIIRDVTLERAREETMRRHLAELAAAQDQLRKQAGQLRALAGRFKAERLRAEAANATKSAFLANMSHELRTPLNAVIGFAELMKDEMLGSMGNERYIQYARDIHESGTLLLSLINDILDLSKIEAGRLKIEPRFVDIRQVVASCLRIVGGRARQGGLRLAADIAEPCPPVYADERSLKQMMVNLLSNAVKFTPPDGAIQVSVGAATSGGIEIVVADTGIGIADEDLPLIFEPFRQIDRSPLQSRQPGTGLGLPLVKSLVELHHGRIDIESRLGIGTTARLTLPPGPHAAGA